MDDQHKLRARIRKRLRELNRGAITAAGKGGLERSYISDFLNEKKRSIKVTEMTKVAMGLDWTVEELLGQTHNNRVMQNNKHIGEPSFDGQIVPELDVRAGASYGGGTPETDITIDDSGAINQGSVRSQWGIPVPFLRDELGVRPGRVHILPIRGDSMADTLYDGDRAIIDLDDTDVSQGGIFALLDDQATLIIKQVELVRGAPSPTIRCKSRNPRYDAFDLILADPVRIVGRVACRITRL